MSAFKPQQLHLTIVGQPFHFVAYEGVPANPKRQQLAVGPMWYLMREGKRHLVMAYLPAQAALERDLALTKWTEAHAIGPAPAREVAAVNPRASLRRDDWWAAN